jgi:division protein CdvB (Snf7/Vps24/ESCRT-III family)
MNLSKLTKNELNLMRYAMEDLLNGDDVPDNKDKFEIQVNEIINKIDNELNR